MGSSGGCNPINWLNQTRRNFSIKYLNLNFVTTPKLRGLHSFFLEKVFILAFVGFPFPWFVPRRTFFDTGKLFRENISNNLQGLTPRVKSRWEKFSVFRYIGQHNSTEIFAVKWNVVTKTSKVLMNDIFCRTWWKQAVGLRVLWLTD